MSCYIDQMKQAPCVSDEVWSQLDPSAARLTSLSRRVLFSGAVLVILLITAVVFASSSGLIRPDLSSPTSSSGADSATRKFDQTAEIHNDGWFAAHVDAISSAAPGVDVVSVTGAGATIRPGHSITIHVTYRVVDCGVARRGAAAPVHLHFHHWWGTTTVTLLSDGGPGMAWLACGHQP